MSNIRNIKTSTSLKLPSTFYLRQNYTIKMDKSMNYYQETSLPDSDNEVIQMLCLDDQVNTGRLLDDIVKNMNLDAYISGIPAAAIGFESCQGHQHEPLGNTMPFEAYQQSAVISYVDLAPSWTKKGRYQQVTDNYMLKAPTSSSQKVSSNVPLTPVEQQSTQRPVTGKCKRRRRESKPKLYQRQEPLPDPEEEKKRQNAIIAKQNRDRQKRRLEEMETLVKSLRVERDALQHSNSKLQNKCEVFEKQLRNVCQRYNVPLVFLPQD
ncbi:unnamed protein product [Meganyctiphanes norvegica]|uniref:BZIP domain-containing protein n=1 Tax=Meganyctiphanes norvegica TaxID=48144 RepID=A0AAV2RPP1_MEGNR